MNRSTVYNDCDNWAAHILTKAIDSGFCKGLMDYLPRGICAMSVFASEVSSVISQL